MTDGHGSGRHTAYQIKVQGKLNEKWSDWFNGMTIKFEDGITTLTGAVADQAKLRGMLSKIWDLNLTLISVNQVEPEESESYLQQMSIPSEPTQK